MNQDAFRQLLHAPPATTQRSITHKSQKAPSGVAEPKFKPRNVKKTDAKYRDRAAERREGVANDYAEVEAILEDFEKRADRETKDVIEEQRRYLGGDSQHTILVKGLDMSLLEQNKARAASSTEDDDILEQAFMATATTATESKKRTREDIIRELKAKKQNETTNQPPAMTGVQTVEEERLALEATKQAGKFKPIGFTPIEREKPKKRKVKVRKEGEKKRRKVEKPSQQTAQDGNASTETQSPAPVADLVPKVAEKAPPPEPEPELIDEDFDIFAGAGEYQGIPDDDQSDSDSDASKRQRPVLPLNASEEPSIPTVLTKGGWFGDGSPEPISTTQVLVPKSPPRETEVEEASGRLKPLESSALPSIRDFLAIAEAAEKEEKRKARKEKKKKKQKGGDEDD